MSKLYRGAWLATVFIAAGCSVGSSDFEARQAAREAATAYCQRLDDCSQLLLQITYGDVPSCAARQAPAYALILAAESTGWSPDVMKACASALVDAPCEDLLGHNLPVACVPPPGGLAEGAPCGDDAECESSFCAFAAGDTCGACGEPPVAGDLCEDDSECPQGDVCAAAGVCEQSRTAGQECSATEPCDPTLLCKGNFCGQPDEVGQSCTFLGTTDIFGSCDAYGGLYCEGANTVCAPVHVTDAGQPCGNVNGITLCSASGQCENGVCLAAAADGAGCDDNVGPACTPPAICLNEVCVVPDPTACGGRRVP